MNQDFHIEYLAIKFRLQDEGKDARGILKLSIYVQDEHQAFFSVNLLHFQKPYRIQGGHI